MLIDDWQICPIFRSVLGAGSPRWAVPGGTQKRPFLTRDIRLMRRGVSKLGRADHLNIDMAPTSASIPALISTLTFPALEVEH
ncbi:MAG: hypothetical protein DRH12_06880 [Deltaproteobacteria bacterium]|nr:MAG: hypothetical protein DRH12_06880 [Deltaproteobacteria bacterium]